MTRPGCREPLFPIRASRLERAYPTLSGLISRCEAPLLNFKWDIKIKSILPKGFTDAEAEAQQQTLRAAYGAVDNLTDAIRHLHMAEFREYAHLQKHRSGDGEVYHLEALDQWMICRDGIYGDWFWNPDSRFTSQPAISCGESNRIGGDVLPLEDFIIRAVPRPINEIALVIFARWALVAKNWDAFIEIYGVPGGVVEMPQNVPPDKEAQYEQSAKAIAEGGVGAIPNGSKYFPNDGPRGTDPFTPRIKDLEEALILAGTGGKMGMLNASAGMGGGNQSKTHDEVFQEIAQSRAAAISETFQRQFDAEVLEREHPGEPALVYFDLSPSEDVDVDGLVKNVVSLAGAGWKADEGWLCEQTGYSLEEKEEPQQDGDPVLKREIAYDQYKKQSATGSAKIANRLYRLSVCSDEAFEGEFELFNRDFPQLGLILNGEKYDDVERWITVGGKHIPIRHGQTVEEAIHEHGHFEKNSTRGEKNRRQNHGQKWHLEQKKKAAKNETKGSQKAGENDKLNHEHDREKSPDSQGDNRASESRPGDSGSSKTDRSGRGESARSGGMSEAEAAHFSALVKQESSAGNNREKQIASAREYLEKSRKSGKIKTTVHDPARHLAQGSEHKVELSEDKRSVIKHTSDGYFGMIPDVSPRGTVSLRSATASEYMTRMQAQNAVFNSDFKFLGSHAESGGGLTYSQTHIKGTKPEEKDVDSFMADRGFVRVTGNADADALHSTTYFHPETGWVAADARPANFKKINENEIRPIDLMVRHAAPASALHEAMQKGISK